MGRTVRSLTTLYCEYCHRDPNEVGNGVIAQTLRSLAHNLYDFTFCGEACMQAWTKEHLRPEDAS